eukprot:scaffold36082_cov51-Phaeocystis_antarctica.AAC.1
MRLHALRPYPPRPHSLRRACDCSDRGAGASAEAHSTVAVLPSSPAAGTPSRSSRPRLTCQIEYGSAAAAATSHPAPEVPAAPAPAPVAATPATPAAVAASPFARARRTQLNMDFCRTEAKSTDHAVAACRSFGASLS